MDLSIFELFRVGIGPSSSHTVGPMRAARAFVDHLQSLGPIDRISRVQVELFGSLALTGKGHATDRGVLLGLEGHAPETVPLQAVQDSPKRIREQQKIALAGRWPVDFDEPHDLVVHGGKSLPGHPNGMRFSAFAAEHERVSTRIYYSVGGGFIVSPDDPPQSDASVAVRTRGQSVRPNSSTRRLSVLLHRI